MPVVKIGMCLLAVLRQGEQRWPTRIPPLMTASTTLSNNTCNSNSNNCFNRSSHRTTAAVVAALALAMQPHALRQQKAFLVPAFYQQHRSNPCHRRRRLGLPTTSRPLWIG